MQRSKTAKLALAGGVAALAFGAAACEVDEDGTTNDTILQDDTFEDDTLGGELDG
jgi:hypothetical protein